MEIPVLDITDKTQDKIENLSESGCLVIKNAISDDTRKKVKIELEPAMEMSPAEVDDPEAFYPGNTKRMSALVALSETSGKLAIDKMSMDICDHFLLPNSNCGYQLHVSAALEVGPGSRKQILHREEDPFPFFDLPRPNLIVASMWAITDFRSDNGATLLVPGSHKWGKDREPKDEEILSAEMPAGSVLYWLGGTLHGAGANVSNDWRYGVILTYSLGWLRQEENQYLDVPSEEVKKLPKDLARLIGYRAYGGLGFSINPEHFFMQEDSSYRD
jgi:ectoine hydroxylase-related dioxygenase (phytanoyl-CoA dioxygenase family)